MSFVRQSTNYSVRSLTSGSSARSLTSASSMGGGLQLVGTGRARISTGVFQTRAPSVYAGAGGDGTRISESIFTTGSGSYGSYGSGSYGSYGSYSESAVINNEKLTMQNLNDRLAAYLEKVRSLEEANRKLELQIREYYERRAPSVAKDLTGYFATISDLRAKILRRRSEHQSVILQIDNAQLAMEDFKIKYETELNMHMNVDADVVRLRGVRDSLTLSVADLESQIDGLKEELAYLKSSHEEEMRLARAQATGKVNVEVDSTESVDLMQVLEEMRTQYEAAAVKNKMELEKWFKAKVETLQTQITSNTTEVRTSSTELTELRRTYQTLEINRQSAIREIELLQQSVEEVKTRYGVQLSQLQMTINSLEAELQQLRVSIEEQQTQYNLLLDIKMRLELEIAEYRRLLEGDMRVEKKQTVVISKVVEEEVQKPHIERRVRTIVEEIVDGKVVSTVVDTETQDIQ